MSDNQVTTLEKQDGFQSQWGFIMSAVGSCVGMANIWRFPMLVSKYGGLTFLIPYFIFVCIISQSGMMEEFSLGRWAGFGPVGSFGRAMEDGGKSKRAGELIGSVPVFASLCLGIGYSVIMGWVFYYTKMALTGELVAMGQDMNVIGGTFGAVAPEAATLGEAIKMTFATGGANNLWIIIAVAGSFAIMIFGISSGIERACKIMIPALYVLMILLAVFMVFVPGTGSGYRYIFTLNPKGLLNPEVWVYAFGQFLPVRGRFRLRDLRRLSWQGCQDPPVRRTLRGVRYLCGSAGHADHHSRHGNRGGGSGQRRPRPHVHLHAAGL